MAFGWLVAPTIGCQDQFACHSERSEESPVGVVTGLGWRETV